MILKTHFDTFRDKRELPPELKEKHECKGLKLFGETDKQKKLLEVWRDWRKGLSWQDSEGNILKGALDNLLVKGKTLRLIVLDYKTRGYALKEDSHKHYIDQLNIYSFLLQKMGYETGDYNFLLFYIPSRVLPTGEVVFDTQLVKIRAEVNGAEKLFRKAIAILQDKCPKHHKEKLCEWCAMIRYGK